MPKLVLAFAAFIVNAAAAMAQSGPVEVKDVWARASPGGAENGAAYLTITSQQGDRLTGVSTPAAAMAELHAMKMEGGIMRMSPLAALDLPPGRKVTLKPGATHIMLIRLKQPLRAGQSIPLTLHFANAGTREVVAAVGKIGAMAPEGHAHGDMYSPMPAAR